METPFAAQSCNASPSSKWFWALAAPFVPTVTNIVVYLIVLAVVWFALSPNFLNATGSPLVRSLRRAALSSFVAYWAVMGVWYYLQHGHACDIRADPAKLAAYREAALFKQQQRDHDRAVADQRAAAKQQQKVSTIKELAPLLLV
jgi:hypothetical protein